MRHFINCWKKSFVFSGRARRSEFWFFHLCYFLFALILKLMLTIPASIAIDSGHTELGVFLTGSWWIFVVAGFCPGVSVMVRRLHDTGRDGWNVGIFGLCPLLAWLFVTIRIFIYVSGAESGFGRNQSALTSSAASAAVSAFPAVAAPAETPSSPGLFGVLPPLLGILFIILIILTLIGGIILLVFFCKDSQPGANKYGPNPKESPLPSSQENNIMESSGKFCPHCGCKLESADAKFCAACGGALGSETRQSMRVVGRNPTPAAPAKTKSNGELVILLIIAGIAAWFSWTNGVFSGLLGPDKDKLAFQVQTSMQRKFDNDPDFREYGKVTVEKVSLVKSAIAHQYNGIASIRKADRTCDVSVKVTVDGDSLMWSIRPFELAPLLRPDGAGGQDFGNMTGDNTEQLLKTAVNVTLGTFSISPDDFRGFTTKLPVTIKNTSSKTRSYFITIAAIDAAGNQLDTDVVSVTDLLAGQSTQKEAFRLVSSEELAAFKAATFKITRVQMM